MNAVDARGCAISGSTPAARDAYERALARALAWRSDSAAPLARALDEAPGFVMAHVLQAYQFVCSRDPRSLAAARPIAARAAALAANARERLHLAAIDAVLGDDYERAKARLSELLGNHPRDVLALQVAHAFDYITGETTRMRERVAAVLPAWSPELPGRDAVVAMHAFALEECREFGPAEDAARAALALNPLNARAHHVMAHVFEMTARPAAGLRWMDAHVASWGVDTVVRTHGHWHAALFHLAEGHADRALASYDLHIQPDAPGDVADLIDASSLLWRIELRGGAAGARWRRLAAAWERHLADAFCSFTDVHAMLAFVGAGDDKRAARLERAVAVAQSLPTRYGATTRDIGLPACRALRAFGRGDDALAVALFASLPPLAHCLGGSQAQRDVLDLTGQRAVERLRRGVRTAALPRRRSMPAVATAVTAFTVRPRAA
jgi:tetratricopeptide (TPR) repeat protein